MVHSTVQRYGQSLSYFTVVVMLTNLLLLQFSGNSVESCFAFCTAQYLQASMRDVQKVLSLAYSG